MFAKPMKKESMSHSEETTDRAAKSLLRTVRSASRWTAPGAMLVLVLMIAGSSLAMVTNVSTSTAVAPNLHLAPPIGSGPATVSSPATHPTPQVPASLPHASSPTTAAAPHPAANSSYVENGRATFFSNTKIPNPTFPNNTCRNYYSYYKICWNITTEPSLNLTSDGYTGLAYTAFTNQSPCAGASASAMSEVGWVVSTDFGFTWSNPVYLGNPVCSGVPDQNYSSAFEPSLTSLANGTFVLSYIEWNTSSTAYAYYSAPPGGLACGYANNSRVVVTESYDHGTTWTTPTVIDATEFNSSIDSCPFNNFADVRPQITAIGNTIYLTWFNASNPIYYYYGTTYSSWVHFTSSTDAGATWSPIQKLLVQGNNVGGTVTDYATAPSIMVDPSGVVYVAYSTNYGQSYICGTQYCTYYTSASILVATSSNNGSTFSYVHAADNVVANYPSFYPYIYWEPFTTLAYNPITSEAYVAYSAAAVSNFCYNNGIYGSYCYQNQVDKIWFQSSGDGGATWSTATNPSPFNTTQDWYSPAYNPSMAVDSAGTVHLQYAYINNGLCMNITVPYTTSYCGPAQDIYVNSTDDGATWSSPLVVAGDYSFTYGPYRDIWDGFTSSTLTAGKEVLLGWTSVNCPNISFNGCYLPYYTTTGALPPMSAEVETSRLYMATGITLTFNETALPAGSIWSVNIQGNLRFGPAGDNLSISGVPPSSSIGWYSPWINQSYGISYYPAYSVTPPSSFTANTTILEVFNKQVLINLLTVPSYPYYVWTYQYYGNVAITPVPGPFWVVSGTTQTFTVSYYASLYTYCYACLNLTFQSWTGTGPGSVTANTTSITFIPTGPVNETANFQLSGVCWGSYYTAFGYPSCMNYTYDLGFQEQGLPGGTDWGVTLISQNGSSDSETSSASLIRFTVGTGLTAFQAWTVPDPNTGMFWVPSTLTTSPLAMPQASTVMITYTLQPIGSSQFSTQFSETGLPSGTAWGLTVGGTSYGIATANGSVWLSGGSTPQVNGSAVYLSNGTGYYVSSIDVTPLVINESTFTIQPNDAFTVNGSSVVLLHYSPMYRVTVSASVGGSATPDAQWVHLSGSLALGESASGGYHFVGWTGTGTGSYTGGTTNPSISPRSAVTEFATFRPNSPATWNVTLQAVGLPAGTAFTMSIGDTTYSGLGSFKVGNISDGVYTILVPTVYLNSTETTRFVPTDVSSTLGMPSGSLNISANGTVSITYTTQYAVSLAATPGGTATWGSSGAVGITWFNASEQVSFHAMPDPHYYFVSWNGTGTGSITDTSGTITLYVSGPTTETAQFQWRPNHPPATYWLQVSVSGLPTGTTWSIAVGGLGASGSDTMLTVVGLNGTYGLTAPTVYTAPGVRWVSNATNATAHVTSNGTWSVSFSEEFAVTVLGASGGDVTPLGTHWVAPGTQVNLAAVANASSDFLSWNGTGVGNYTGSSASYMVTVTGPITEQVAFGPKPVHETLTSSAGNGQLMALGLLVALLLAGLVVGLLVGRRRSRPPMSEAEPAMSEDEAPMGGPEEPTAAPMAEYDEGPPSS